MRPRIAALALAISSLAAFGQAQVRAGTFEITPFYGYLWGGSFARGTTGIYAQRVDMEGAGVYGVGAGYFFNSVNEVELRWARSQTHFVPDNHDGGGPIFGNDGNDVRLGDLTIDYYMANWIFNFGHSRFVPYISIGAGAAVLDPNDARILCPTAPCPEASSATRFTAAIGGGVKYYFNRHIGLRFDGRANETYLNSGHGGCSFDNGHGFCSSSGSNWLVNGEVSGGVIFAF